MVRAGWLGRMMGNGALTAVVGYGGVEGYISVGREN